MCVRRAVLLAVLLPAYASAQSIRGAVVGRADSVPVPGAVVQLINSAGEISARALTNERGEFRLVAPAPGSYRLRTLRIGYRPTTSDAVELTGGQEVVRTLAVANVVFALDTVRVVRRSTCKLGADSALATYAIWEQIRTALNAAAISVGQEDVGATLVVYERTLDARNAKRVLNSTSYLHTGNTNKLWTSLSADSLHRVGYVAEFRSWTVYSAPDIDALLSAEFQEDHCFRIAEKSDAAQLGLSFEPTRERKRIPEIKGTVWLDRKTSELRRMEFRYTNISRMLTSGSSGGEMEFIRMKNGRWAISRWYIQMPVLVRSLPSDNSAYYMAAERVRIAALQRSGGELAVVTSGADTLWSRAPMVLYGTVVDSLSGRSVPYARVTLGGTTRQAVADVSGRFSIAGMLPGQYTLQVQTSTLDSLGTTWHTPVEFADESEVYLARMPTVDALVESLCPAPPARGTGILVGAIKVTGDSQPARDLDVRAEWIEGQVDPRSNVIMKRTPHALEVRTDANGTFRICGIPIDAQIHVRTALSDGIAARGRIVPGTRFTRIDVVSDGVVQRHATDGARQP
jgi:hypothetical protein